MPTVHEKYAAATAYVQGVVAAVEKQSISYVVNPTTGRVAWFAGTDQAAPFRFELAVLAARWHHAGSADRDQIVRAAQALAVVAMQTLPPSGCTRDAGLIDMQTPGSTKAEIETVATLIRQLDGEIGASYVDNAFKAAWRSFADEWQRFYGDHSGWWDRFWYSAYEKTIEFRRRTSEWRESFVALGGRPAAPTDHPPETPTNLIASVGKLLLVGGGLALGWKAFDYLRARQRENQLGTALNAELARVAEDAGVPP